MIADDNRNKVDSDSAVVESQKTKLKYPRSIAFIVGNEFCERFSFYGMRTILVLYLSSELKFSDDDSTVIFHVFSMLVYFMCIPGAIIADSWLGKFYTIFYLSCVYVVGTVLVSLTAIPSLNIPQVAFTMVGLVLIAAGSGGIKPCVSAFGGDQFILPEQAKQAAVFFSIFYFSVNSGSLISTLVTPILREDVHCFGDKSCYSLAFGVPAVLMFTSIIIFVLGRSMYKIKKPAGNMLVLICKTIGAAISGRFREKKTNPREHWLDYADTKYDRDLISDTKVLMRILVLYIPLPVFWALFDQQASRWTFQATRMDGTLGSIIIKPDQIQLVNPFLILTFIPLYEALFYPLLAKIGIKRPLQKLFCGGVLAGVAFCISGAIELELEKTYPVFPNSNQAELRIFNGYDCNFTVTTNIPEINTFDLSAVSVYEKKYIDVSKNTNFEILSAFPTSGKCEELNNLPLNLEKGEAKSFLLKGDYGDIYSNKQFIGKSTKGTPEVQFYTNILEDKAQIQLRYGDTNTVELENTKNGTSDMVKVAASTYDLYVDNKLILDNLELKQGGVYAILIGPKEDNSYVAKSSIITTPNSMSMLWLLPQYIIMTLGEVMFSVTGLEFSYSQAPKSMKSVLQACWLLTVALGNVIVIIIAEAKIFDSQAFEFFLFAGLMFVDMVLFSYLAYRYKPNVVEHSVEDDNEDDNLKKDKDTDE